MLLLEFIKGSFCVSYFIRCSPTPLQQTLKFTIETPFVQRYIRYFLTIFDIDNDIHLISFIVVFPFLLKDNDNLNACTYGAMYFGSLGIYSYVRLPAVAQNGNVSVRTT
jgi:hypothetical protein